MKLLERKQQESYGKSKKNCFICKEKCENTYLKDRKYCISYRSLLLYRRI